jgi:hypothetical protein
VELARDVEEDVVVELPATAFWADGATTVNPYKKTITLVSTLNIYPKDNM